MNPALQKEARKALLLDLFKNHHNKQVDDSFEGRDELLKDIEEVFAEQYNVSFRCIALDTEEKNARSVLKELVNKI